MEYVPKNHGEKKARKNIFEIPRRAKPFLKNLFLLHEKVDFYTKLQIK